ncbi:unnamed protein product [Echinostoma caproni]|uniref:Nodal modulator 1 n=1 Tax=Echinostoma caproni TaxID=27848 RepID=A0A183ASK1_9TREM|nr:unnamed protein product [Echinostoma caproni]
MNSSDFPGSWLNYSRHLLLVTVLLIDGLLLAHAGDTVVGCGGFIRWHSSVVKSKIDYNQLKVNLYLGGTDTLKDVTEVLPNSAFSVPLYDQGSYRLKLATPKGWYVEPANGYLLDLRTDPTACNKDFNFEILGFAVTGQVCYTFILKIKFMFLKVVTFGLNTGPEGLVVRFTSVQDKTEIHTRTLTGGYFNVGPLVPGEYTLTVSDGEQTTTSDHIRARQSVSVGSNPLTLQKPIVLLGHFVRGHVADFAGQSLKGVTIYLLTNSSTANIDCALVSESTKRKVQLPPDLDEKFQLVCETLTDTAGQFSFNRLPGGDYILLPQYSLMGSTQSKRPVEFAFKPPVRHVTVAHTDINLGPAAFQTAAFQLRPGRVIWPNGQPIREAKIDAKDAEFTDVVANLTPETENLPTLQPTRLSVCGRLATAVDLPKRVTELEQFVVIKDVKSGTVTRTEAKPGQDGFRFCAFLSPGRYEIRPEVRTGDTEGTLAYFVPASHNVSCSLRAYKLNRCI